jgi:molybdopterin synthase catalytic subunit
MTSEQVRVRTAISDQPLSVSDAQGFVTDPGAGAIVVFTGTVRDASEGRSVSGLTYEAYAERAEVQLQELAGRAMGKWPDLRALWMVHRVGALAISEPAVVVASSAPHRASAFEAAAWVIETLKSEVAIWKQEHWTDGAAHWPGTD